MINEQVGSNSEQIAELEKEAKIVSKRIEEKRNRINQLKNETIVYFSNHMFLFFFVITF